MLRLVVVGLLAAGCAHVPVREELTLYRGEPLEGLERVTFDGALFDAPGHGSLARDEVQTVHFRPVERGRAADSADAAGDALSEEARALLERGHAMAQRYPGVAGVILVDDGDFAYRRDGTHHYRYHFAGLVLREEAKAWAQFSVGFTEGRSRVRVLAARTVAADGTVSVLPPEALRVGSPSEAEQFFNPSRKVMGGLIPGVEVGSVIEYIYEFENYNPEDPRLFFPGYRFQASDPVVRSRVSVRVPRGLPFHHMTRNFPAEASGDPQVERRGGDMLYTWTLEEAPPLVPEPFMPPEEDVVPMMAASVFGSFEEVYRLQRDLQLARMRLTPEIEAAAREIVGDAATPDEKVARLYHWVQENTRYISIKGSLGSGLSGHTAQETFENRYGDCTDKAILFGTLCKAVGVTCHPIILMTNDSGVGITEIPAISGNHCISEVILDDGRAFYLDSTAQNFRYPYFRADNHGAVAVNAIRGDMKPIPVPPPDDNLRESRLVMTLNADGDVSVKTSNRYNGNIEAGIRGFWKRVREDERPARMMEYVNSISPGAVLREFTLSDLDDLAEPVTMTIAYDLPGHAIRARDLMYLRMPTLERDYPEAALESRRFPIQYMTSEERRLEMDLDLPPGFRVKWHPPAVRIASPYFEYEAAYEDGGATVRLRESFRRLKRTVPVEEYPAYRDALRAIAAFSQQEIFLTSEER